MVVEGDDEGDEFPVHLLDTSLPDTLPDTLTIQHIHGLGDTPSLDIGVTPRQHHISPRHSRDNSPTVRHAKGKGVSTTGPVELTSDSERSPGHEPERETSRGQVTEKRVPPSGRPRIKDKAGLSKTLQPSVGGVQPGKKGGALSRTGPHPKQTQPGKTAQQTKQSAHSSTRGTGIIRKSNQPK